MGNEREEPAKTATPAGQSPHADEQQRMGATPRNEVRPTRVPDPLTDSITLVIQRFNWYNTAAQRRLDALETEIGAEDEPDWSDGLLTSVLEVALGAGSAAAGVKLTSMLVPGAGEVAGELVKMLFEGGIGQGVEAGRKKLIGGSDADVLGPFIASQKEAVEAAHHVRQTEFVTSGQYKIQTVKAALDLAETCRRDNVERAAEEQYRATRDAWLTYLAQAKFGAIGSKGAVQPSDHDPGVTRTNMSTKEQRQRTNRHAPGTVPTAAPDVLRSQTGDAPGVLAVVARLPVIYATSIAGRPEVLWASLNGVNQTIRQQYQGVPLATVKVPRQVRTLKPDGSQLELSIDETGQARSVAKDERAWFAQRAVVGHPENATKDEWWRVQEGIRLLLTDLVPDKVYKQW